LVFFFFFNDTATTEIYTQAYTLSLHDALPIPKGRDSAMEYVRRFVEDVQSSGLLAQAMERAGLRGTMEAE
jgi:hypothetical protein